MSTCPFKFNDSNLTISNIEFKHEIRESLEFRFLFENPSRIRNFMIRTLWINVNENHLFLENQDFSVFINNYFNNKQKADDLYKQKNYEKSLDSYLYLFSLFKKLSYHKIQKNHYKSNKINESIYLVQITNFCQEEEELIKYCMCSLLKGLCLSFIGLRFYRSALDCLDLAIEIEKKPELFYLRSQLNAFNLTFNNFNQALKDSNICIVLSGNKLNYLENDKKIRKFMEIYHEKEDSRIESTYKLI